MTRPSGARWPPSASSGKYSASHAFLVTSYVASSLLDCDSSGPKSRKLSLFRRMISRIKMPRKPALPTWVVPGFLTSTPRVRKSGMSSDFLSSPPLATGLALIPRPPFGGQAPQSRDEPARMVEMLLRLVAAQPFLQDLQMRGIGVDVRQRDLVRPPEAFQVVPVHLARGRPAFGGAENDHGP